VDQTKPRQEGIEDDCAGNDKDGNQSRKWPPRLCALVSEHLESTREGRTPRSRANARVGKARQREERQGDGCQDERAGDATESTSTKQALWMHE
jgi:hypothetical protein